MQNKIYGYIYIITNIVNNKKYIGQTIRNVKSRFRSHIDESKKLNTTMAIALAIKKYGIENFIVEQVDIAYSQNELNLLEGIYISWFNTLTCNDRGYNVKNTINGKGSHSEETKLKIKNRANESERLKLASNIGKNTRGKSHTYSKSKYCGVSLNHNKWSASYSYNNKKFWIGVYSSEIDAAKAYDMVALQIYGNDTNINFPELREQYIKNEIIVIKSSIKKSNSKIIGVCFNKQKQKWVFRRKNIYKSFPSKEDAENFGLDYNSRQ